MTGRTIDLVAGCPPCQGYSRLRTMNGARQIDDPRNDLLLEYQRFVEELRPVSVMMENVPGLQDHTGFLEFRRVLASLGYCGNAAILNVADFGVPQRRRRLLYIAGYRRHIPLGGRVASYTTVRDTLRGLPKAGNSGDYVHDIPERRSDRVKRLIRRIPKDGGSRTDLPDEIQLECHKRCSGFTDVYGRMAWDAVAPTITSGCFNPSKGRFLHPEEDRAITIREAALLQGFPSDYKFPNDTGKENLAEMIGNAIPPPFVEVHSTKIAQVVRKQVESGVEIDRNGTDQRCQDNRMAPLASMKDRVAIPTREKNVSTESKCLTI